MDLLRMKNVSKIYKIGDIVTKAIDDVNITIKAGEIVVILGASGSGKTTMLNCMSGLDTVSNGEIMFKNKRLTDMSDRKITNFRKEHLGFIFQTYNLLEHLNVYENILVGAKLGNECSDINEIMKTVGLYKHKNKYMYQLSGGEQQRVSIARALAKQPELMFCDEPTGALDEKTGKIVLESLVNANERFHTTILIITHNPGIASIADRVIKMNSGKIIEEKINKKRLDPKDIAWG